MHTARKIAAMYTSDARHTPAVAAAAQPSSFITEAPSSPSTRGLDRVHIYFAQPVAFAAV
jgi:hypothetical protein